jgi:hypothetical protein
MLWVPVLPVLLGLPVGGNDDDDVVVVLPEDVEYRIQSFFVHKILMQCLNL